MKNPALIVAGVAGAGVVAFLLYKHYQQNIAPVVVMAAPAKPFVPVTVSYYEDLEAEGRKHNCPADKPYWYGGMCAGGELLPSQGETYR